VDHACDRFEAAWKAGQRPRIEDYLALAPELERPALLHELLWLEAAYRRQAGDSLRAEEFLARFPGLDPDWLAGVLSAAAHPADRRTTLPEAPSFYEPGDTLLGRKLGPYRIEQRLGEGGMGTVYRALRQDAYQQRVALKVIRPGLDSDEVLQRFQTERQVLAELPHPHIARLLDGGTTDDGRPYFVMEYIDGEPLDRYCDRQQLSTQERLRLLQAVCEAVQYAHARQVIHRDLKPSNVLVTAEGTPRVTDFGLAKRLASSPGMPGSTPSGAILGTPSYMAPEQAAGKGNEIGVASDVYALGAILYELLVGRPPFRAETPLDTLLQVLSEEPVPPGRLHPKLSRDLETICLKCLNKEPHKRYPSAAALADDLGRFLKGEPIHARPVGQAERLLRWCRRNPVVAVLAASAALFLLGGTGISTYFAIQADRRAEEARANLQAAQRNLAQAEQQRDRADSNFRLARDAVDKTVNKITDNPRLKEADFHQLRHDLLQYLVPFYEQLVEQRQDDPELKADQGQAWSSLAMLRQEMGDSQRARSDYEQVLAIFGQLAKNFPTVPQYRQNLAKGHNNLGGLLLQLGKRNEAEAAYRDALSIFAQLAQNFPTVPQYRHSLAQCHNNLGGLLFHLRKHGEAEAAFRDALSIFARLAQDFPAVPQYRQNLAQCHTNLGVLFRSLGKNNDAETTYRDALQTQTQLAKDFPSLPQYREDLARSHFNLGNLMAQLDKRDEAEGAYRDALRIQRQLATDFAAAPEYRHDLAGFHHNLGHLLHQLGKRAEAEAAYRDGLKIQEQLAKEYPHLPDYQNDLARTLVNLAILVQSGKDHAQARQLLEQAVPHHRAALKANDRNPTYRGSFRINRRILAGALLDLRDHTAAADAADQLVQAAVDPAMDVYTAACIFSRCVPLAEHDSQLSETQRKERVQAYADRAVATLRQAVRNGFKDVARMKKDTDLDALRSHPEFRKLLKELEGQGKTDGKWTALYFPGSGGAR
jgi:tetratricopeptide (TPR) repeat protein